MKIIALLLVIANLMFFAWQYPLQKFNDQGGSGGAIVNEQEHSSQQSLMMLKELPKVVADKVVTVELDNDSPVMSSTQNPVSIKTASCWSLGPFLTDADADAGMKLLTAISVKGRTVHRQGRAVSGYRVLLPAQDSMELVQSTMKNLQARGVKDIAMLHIQGRYAVALGFFSRNDSAQQRYKYIVRLGYSPIIEEVYRKTATFWIELYNTANSPEWENGWSKLLSIYPDIRREPRKCG